MSCASSPSSDRTSVPPKADVRVATAAPPAAVATTKTAVRLRRLRRQPGYSTKKNADWQAKNPEKRAAHKAVEWALKRGDLLRGACVRCGAEKAQAHHDDYSKPLEVMWLCRAHHVERHAELKLLASSQTAAVSSDAAGLSVRVSVKNATTFAVAAASEIISKSVSTTSIPTT